MENTMKEYCVKIVEVRYEYIEAPSSVAALKKAESMMVTNADEVHCEIVQEDFLDEVLKS